MISLKSIEIVNFMSYGEEPVRIDFAGLGPALIVGEAGAEDGSSNGAGKSSIATAILWCLFGRTVNKERPGDAIVNWFNKKDCYVKLETTDGYEITRRRKFKGSAELSIVKGGADLTASTTTNAQVQLKKLFDLDYEIFTSCVFFGQLSKSFLELPDAKRRSILERVFNLHRINIWADVAKEKVQASEVEQAKVASTVEQIEREIESARRRREEEITQKNQYEQKRQARVKALQADKKRLQDELDERVIPDVEDLKRKWEIIDKINKKLTEYKENHRTKAALVFSLKRDLSRLDEEEEAWQAKADTTCPSCRQAIGKDHIATICQPFAEKRSGIKGQMDMAQGEADQIEKLVSATTEKVKASGPKQSVSEAEAIMREISRLRGQIRDLDSQVKEVKGEENPYGGNIKKWDESISENEGKLVELKKKVENYNILIRHLAYIHAAYNDKKKLKSTLLGDLVPFLNERVSYYLNAFGCDFDLKFSPTLQDTTSRWDYEYHSGGERKRIDLAVMFAFYDLYVAIYGPQCNVVVLDEVDGRLDPVGVQAFVDVVERDFTKKENQQNRPDAVLVISHKDEMRDAFSTKIKVAKQDGFSTITEIR